MITKTKKRQEIVDVTDSVSEIITKKKITDGICTVTVAHTTCAVTTMDLDPGTDEDFLDAIEKMFPKGEYRHPHDPSHVGEHIMASIVGPSVSIPIKNGELVLGTWQRIVLVELSGPRERNLSVEISPVL